ncbi:hypothetical protein EAF04_000140 [Stromatinia cepivora]|nr:hypothetical protein EAF04_000140 [Stromatinia cepivora]
MIAHTNDYLEEKCLQLGVHQNVGIVAISATNPPNVRGRQPLGRHTSAQSFSLSIRGVAFMLWCKPQSPPSPHRGLSVVAAFAAMPAPEPAPKPIPEPTKPAQETAQEVTIRIGRALYAAQTIAAQKAETLARAEVHTAQCVTEELEIQYSNALAAQGPPNKPEEDPAQNPPKETETPWAASPAQSHSGLTDLMEDLRRIGS